jgi:hypothetical protein
VWPVITNVECFGFNKKFILASSKNNYQVNYWIIDKTKVANEIFSKEEGDRIAFQNVKKIDSLKFYKIKKIRKHRSFFYFILSEVIERKVSPCHCA